MLIIQTFFIKNLINIYIVVLLLRIWMQWTYCDFYNPFSQLILKMTKFIIEPLHSRLPDFMTLSHTALLLVFTLSMIKFPLLIFIETHILFLDYIYILIGILNIIKYAVDLIFWIIITRSLLSWISPRYNHINIFIYRLTDPLIYIIHRFLPSFSVIDFSPTIIILILYIINNLCLYFFPVIWSIL